MVKKLYIFNTLELLKGIEAIEYDKAHVFTEEESKTYGLGLGAETLTYFQNGEQIYNIYGSGFDLENNGLFNPPLNNLESLNIWHFSPELFDVTCSYYYSSDEELVKQAYIETITKVIKQLQNVL